MALTREYLKGLGEFMSDELIEGVMKEHGISTQKIKDSADTFKSEWEKTKTDLNTANEILKKFDGVDLVKLQSELNAALENNTKLQGDFDGYKLTAEKDALLREKLAGIKFSSNYARNGIYADVKDQVKYEDGKLAGFDEAINALKESQPTAFAADMPAPPPKDSGAPHKEGGTTNDDFNFNFTPVRQAEKK